MSSALHGFRIAEAAYNGMERCQRETESELDALPEERLYEPT